jgi:hypothetical protein
MNHRIRLRLWIPLLLVDALIALLVGGKSVAPCLGLIDGHGACVAAWRASLSPFDRLIYDAPAWLVLAVVFVALVVGTVALIRVCAWAWARLRAPDIRAR